MSLSLGATEDVGSDRAEKSRARDLRETSDKDARGAVMALEVSMGEFAECSGHDPRDLRPSSSARARRRPPDGRGSSRTARLPNRDDAKSGGVPVGAMFGPAATVLLTAGGRPDPELLRFAEAEGLDAIEFYGSSEASIVALTPRRSRREGCAGRAVADASVRIDADGELLVRSPGLMAGYFGDVEMTRQVFTRDGYYRTAGRSARLACSQGLILVGHPLRDRPRTPRTMTDPREAIRRAILDTIPDASVAVDAGSGGHFTIHVVSPVFSGKSMVESQRLVYGAIAHLMRGEGAPVHAVDKLTTKIP